MKPQTEKRKITTANVENEYEFLVIQKPEDWQEANAFKGRYELDLGVKKWNVALSGISYLEWEQQEEMYPYPEKPEAENFGEKIPREVLEKHEALVESIRQKRKVFLFQATMGMQVPGKDMEEKVQWLDNRGYDAVESFYAYLEMQMTALADNPLLEAYNTDSSQSIATECTELKSLDDWDVADKTHAIFRICRNFDNYITEFNLRRIPHELKAKIDRETMTPDPPQKPGRNPMTKKFDPNFFEPNTKDPRWLQTCTAMRHKKTVMLLEATLPFQIPGSDYKEKHTWISKRLIGDVHKLQQFITNELLGYRRQLDFFTSNSDQKS